MRGFLTEERSLVSFETPLCSRLSAMFCTTAQDSWPKPLFSKHLPRRPLSLLEVQQCTTSCSVASSKSSERTSSGTLGCLSFVRSSESRLRLTEESPAQLELCEVYRLLAPTPRPEDSTGTAVRAVLPGESRGVLTGVETSDCRNVLLVGCVGSGKKTLANKIAGEPVFEVLPSIEVMNRRPELRHSTSRAKSGHYFLLYDTTESDSVQGLKDACRSDPVIRQGVHLIVFALNENVGANDDLHLFLDLLSSVQSSGKKVRIVLVVTGCEKRDPHSKAHLRRTLLSSPLTARVANFVDDIIMVGFPSALDTASIFMDIYAPGTKESETTLQAYVSNCSEVYSIDDAFTTPHEWNSMPLMSIQYYWQLCFSNFQ